MLNFVNIFIKKCLRHFNLLADVEYKQYLLSTGQLDDAHTLPIAGAKASLTADVLIALWNKTVESYNELIKMSV